MRGVGRRSRPVIVTKAGSSSRRKFPGETGQPDFSYCVPEGCPENTYWEEILPRNGNGANGGGHTEDGVRGGRCKPCDPS